MAVFGAELPETGALETLEALEALEVLEVLGTLEALDGPEGPIIVPGPTSGVSIKVRRECETITGESD
jgi:hypothetical protein